MGRQRRTGSTRSPRPGAPRIRVLAYSLMGGIDVWRLPEEAKGVAEQARSSRRRKADATHVVVRFPLGRDRPEQPEWVRARHRVLLPRPASRDPRFDGVFFIGVTSTGIYRRPSCPAGRPSAKTSASTARRPKRRSPASGSPVPAGRDARLPEWNIRADLAGRAMRLVTDGVVDRDGVAGLAARLGYSERQVHRTLVEELGAGPQWPARAQRAHTARILLETTDLPVTEVVYAAGFTSIRQFNDTVREVFATTPTDLRRRSRTGRRGRLTRSPARSSSGCPPPARRPRRCPGIPSQPGPYRGSKRSTVAPTGAAWCSHTGLALPS